MSEEHTEAADEDAETSDKYPETIEARDEDVGARIVLELDYEHTIYKDEYDDYWIVEDFDDRDDPVNVIPTDALYDYVDELVRTHPRGLVEPDESDGDEESESENARAPTGDEAAAMALHDVANLVNNERDSHGDAVANQSHIGQAWTWYLQGKGLLSGQLNGSDVARMMALLKMSRAAIGEENVDHDRDIAGYGGIAAAGQVARGEAPLDDLQVTEVDEA